jgi:hypothetical protein
MLPRGGVRVGCSLTLSGGRRGRLQASFHCAYAIDGIGKGEKSHDGGGV